MSKWSQIFEKRLKKGVSKELLRFSYTNYILHTILESYCGSKTFFEYGAGTGMHSICMAMRGHKVIFSDVDKDVLKLFNKTKHHLNISIVMKQIDIINQNLCFLKSPTMTFSDGVLEHFSEKGLKKVLINQQDTDIITFAVPTNWSIPDERSYGNERYKSIFYYLKIIKNIYPTRDIDIYPLDHNNLFFIILRRILLFKFGYVEKFFASSVLFVIKPSKTV